MSSLILPVADVAAKVAAAGFTGWQVATGVAVIWAESRFDAYAVNVVADDPQNRAYRSLDVGLFQLNTYWHPHIPMADRLDPDANIAWGRRLFLQMFDAAAGTYTERVRAGWSPWVTYRNGLHKPFEGDAAAVCRAIGIEV